MTPLPPIARFNEAVHAGLGRWVPAVISAAADSLAAQSAGGVGPMLRAQAGEAHRTLRGAAPALAEAFGAALRTALGHGTTRAAPAGPAGASLSTFMLIAEDQIDEDIEVARIAQGVEADAEHELRRLAALCSGLRGQDAVHFDAIPLPPLTCARALRSSLSTLPLDNDLRLLMLQHLGTALSGQLRRVYREQLRELDGWGVEPARYLIRPTTSVGTRATPAGVAPRDAAGSATAAPESARRTATAGAQPETLAALARLVEWAQRQVPAVPGGTLAAVPADADAGAAPTLTFRLDALATAAPRPGAVTAPSLDPARAAQVMAQLFAQIERQADLSPVLTGLLQRLQGASQRVTAQQGDLWRTVEHPWWQMLDRMMALGATLEETRSGELDIVGAALDKAVARLEAAQTIDRTLCTSAVADIDRAAATWVKARGLELDTEFGAVQHELARQEAESAIRSQAAADLRAQPVAQPLHRFLVGPWAQAMTETALKFGLDSSEFAAQAGLFEQLQAAGRETVTREVRRLLIARARPGLLQAGMAPERVDAELQDLAAVLRRPPPPPEPPPTRETPAAGVPLAERHGVYLTTVPIDMNEPDGPTAATLHCEAWLDSMVPGMRFHMFLLDRWMSTQLSWASPNRQLFVFGSRHGGRVHTMTRRVLEKLRLAGLATTLHPGQLLAEAMDSLASVSEGAPHA